VSTQVDLRCILEVRRSRAVLFAILLLVVPLLGACVHTGYSVSDNTVVEIRWLSDCADSDQPLFNLRISKDELTYVGSKRARQPQSTQLPISVRDVQSLLSTAVATEGDQSLDKIDGDRRLSSCVEVIRDSRVISRATPSQSRATRRLVKRLRRERSLQSLVCPLKTLSDPRFFAELLCSEQPAFMLSIGTATSCNLQHVFWVYQNGAVYHQTKYGRDLLEERRYELDPRTVATIVKKIAAFDATYDTLVDVPNAELYPKRSAVEDIEYVKRFLDDRLHIEWIQEGDVPQGCEVDLAEPSDLFPDLIALRPDLDPMGR
jgi:hypothetical protein